ncbi:hypothetical protein [Sphingobium nicotianae]|uniref:Sugar lactone lactonase YvrE n=1 Tax=Sphingobium nicotianae TaxID=2782607 RepID=A0A9X1IQV4_9SPHN|nr:hypothetical protein [Sphingobium nicotianae]MBT2186916.1 hypothetical protein [Sphingobium nicotianae]
MRRSARAVTTLGFLLLATPAIAKAPSAIKLPDRQHPESISIANGFAHAGSLKGGVVRISMKTGKAAPFIKPGAAGSSSTFGVLADTVNGLLWVCSNDQSARGITIEGAQPGSVLHAFDLKTGVGKLSLPLPAVSASPLCNDMAVARDGTLYVAETSTSHILRWKKGGATLEDWYHDPVLGTDKGSGLDGIAVGADGNLYVNNVQGNTMARVTIQSDGTPGKATALALSAPINGPDGLRALGGLRFVQAEGRGGKVAVVTIDGDTAQIETVAEGLASPTTVDVHDGVYWYTGANFPYLFDPVKKTQTPPPFALSPAIPYAGH